MLLGGQSGSRGLQSGGADFVQNDACAESVFHCEGGKFAHPRLYEMIL